MNNAPDVPKDRFFAMTMLDENRAKTQLAQKAGVDITDVKNLTIWGNHSATQYPDLYNAKINGKSAAEVINDDDGEPSWYHYVIIFVAIFGFFALAYFGFNHFHDNSKVNNPNLLIDLYKYDFETSDGRKVGIQFFNPIDTIDTFDYPIEVDKLTFTNSQEIYISFFMVLSIKKNKKLLAALYVSSKLP